MTVREKVSLAKSVLEALCIYSGIVRLEGPFKRTGHHKNSGPHTRNENQAYTKWRPQVSGTSMKKGGLKKAGLNILGLDTTAQDDKGEYEHRSKVLLRGFLDKEWVNTPVFFSGSNVYTPDLEGKHRFPQISNALVPNFLELYEDLLKLRDYQTKAKRKESEIKKAVEGSSRGGSWGGDIDSVLIDTPCDHWEISMTPPSESYSWKAYSKDEIGLKKIRDTLSGIDTEIDELGERLRDLSLSTWMEVLPVTEQFRAIELGILETAQLTGTVYSDKIVFEERMDKTYVPEAQAKQTVADGDGEWSTYVARGVEKSCVVAKKLDVEHLDHPIFAA